MFDWHDIAERALWTAAQAFVGALPSGFVFTDISAWRVAALAGVAAGIGFLVSVVKNLARQRLEGKA
jgi:hypothetical protein